MAKSSKPKAAKTKSSKTNAAFLNDLVDSSTAENDDFALVYVAEAHASDLIMAVSILHPQEKNSIPLHHGTISGIGAQEAQKSIC